MNQFRCRSEDGHYEKTLRALDHEDAAEDWAEHAYSASGNEWREGVCIVRELDADGNDVGEVRRYEIHADWSPTFTAYPTRD